MIYGIYLKNRPKGQWQLTAIAVSQEETKNTMEKLQDTAIKQGKETEIAFQTFEVLLHIPEFLSEVKKQPLLFN